MASGGPTVTQRDQLMVEQGVGKIYTLFSELPTSSKSFIRPWLCYWILHSIALLDESIEPEMEDDAIDFLSRCKMPHLATTYVLSTRSLRWEIGIFFMTVNVLLHRMHDGGEVDVRACYTAISVASILNILDGEFVKDTGSYILSCQTYGGGIAAVPGTRAHGGYTFCGLATMILIDEVDRLDLPRLIDWLVFQQGVECGLQGRTNKLVDGCYSFWQGGTLTLLEWLCQLFYGESSWLEAGDGLSDSSLSDASGSSGEEGHATHDHRCSDRGLQNITPSVHPRDTSYNFIQGRRKRGLLFNSLALQRYILLLSQLQDGGFRDKPGKNRDFYQSCYCLSGLSASQYSSLKDCDTAPLPQAILGQYSNLLEPIHPLHNVVLSKYHEARDYLAAAQSKTRS